MAVESGRPAWESRLRDAGAHVEDDLRRVISYINDEVVPDVRRNGSVALRAAATELGRLAERMEHRSGGTAVPPSPPPRPAGEPER